MDLILSVLDLDDLSFLNSPLPVPCQPLCQPLHTGSHPFPEAAMFLRVLKFLTTLWLTSLLLSGCLSKDPAAPPATVTVKAGESSAIVSWEADPAVEYWLFFAPKSVAPTTTDMSRGWTDLLGGSVIIRAKSPATVINLVNDTEYVFTVNGRVDGGPGGKGAPLTYATPRAAGTQWSASTSPLNAAQGLRAATYGGVYVAAGLGGALVTSADGVTYATVNSTTNRQLNGATFLGGYKLVGDGGTILTSADAITWASQTSNTTNHLYGVGTNGLTTTVAVGAAGTILTSSDGLTWKPVVSNTSNDLYAVAYSNLNGGLWIAVGAGGVILKSPDADAWTPVNMNSGTPADLRGVSYALLPLATGQTTATSAFVAVGAGGTILTSADGSNWIRSTATINSKTGTNLSSINWNAVTYGKQFVVVGSGGNILTSKDGITFIASDPTGTPQELYAVARGYLGYSAAGAAATVLLSK